MVTLLIGKKGSGKTKTLIELANQAVKNSQGNVVVIEKGKKLTYDLTYEARLVDTEAYSIDGYNSLYGFISGICAGNYDVTDIFVDSTFKICKEGISGLSDFASRLEDLNKETKANITLLISASEDEIPKDISALCKTV